MYVFVHKHHQSTVWMELIELKIIFFCLKYLNTCVSACVVYVLYFIGVTIVQWKRSNWWFNFAVYLTSTEKYRQNVHGNKSNLDSILQAQLKNGIHMCLRNGKSKKFFIDDNWFWISIPWKTDFSKTVHKCYDNNNENRTKLVFSQKFMEAAFWMCTHNG